MFNKLKFVIKYLFPIISLILAISSLIISYKYYKYVSKVPELELKCEFLDSKDDVYGIPNAKYLFDPNPKTHYLNTKRVNKIIIRNKSDIDADDVLIHLTINSPLLIATVSISELYPESYWFDSTKYYSDKTTIIKLDKIFARSSCNILFSYAYPKNVARTDKSLDELQEDNLTIKVTHSNKTLTKSFFLEY